MRCQKSRVWGTSLNKDEAYMKLFTERRMREGGGVRPEFHSRPFTDSSFHGIHLIPKASWSSMSCASFLILFKFLLSLLHSLAHLVAMLLDTVALQKYRVAYLSSELASVAVTVEI